MRLRQLIVAALAAVTLGWSPAGAQEAERPNILVIWGDDIGFWNLSAYSRGAMGYRTPNIDRVANEGAIFTDHYAEPSCTAGRAAFITGQLPIRSGMTTVGMPGSPIGMKQEIPSIASVMKQQGYRTGQFGKNHLGDRNEHLPTMHGFDEFFGNLYHLNTEQEPEDVDYPKDPAFKAKFGPRGVLHTFATDTPDPTEDPRFGVVGRQTIEDTGPLTIERMKTVDGEFVGRAIEFMTEAKGAGDPFFVWVAASRMHTFTHVPQEYLDRCVGVTSGDDVHCAGMIQHDEDVGLLLDFLHGSGLAENTIVIYSTDNGPEHSTYPHGATTPYRSEKMTTWEGGTRVPMMVRWPGRIAARSEFNGIQNHTDLFTTLATAAGAPDIVGRLAVGDDLGTGTVKRAHIDGVDNLPYWTGKADESARRFHIYYAEANLQAVRYGAWKMHFYTRDGYYGTTTKLDLPWLFNVRQDPFESFDQAPGPRANLLQQKTYMFHFAIDLIQEHLASLIEYPPVQAAGTLSVGDIVKEIIESNPATNR